MRWSIDTDPLVVLHAKSQLVSKKVAPLTVLGKEDNYYFLQFVFRIVIFGFGAWSPLPVSYTCKLCIISTESLPNQSIRDYRTAILP